MRTSIVVLGLGFAALAFATGCANVVTRSGVGNTQSTSATGAGGGGTGGEGVGGQSSIVATTGSVDPCEVDPNNCPPPLAPAIAIKWGDVPPIDTGSGDTTASTSSGGDPDPNSILLILAAPGVACGNPFNSNNCDASHDISITLTPDQMVAGAVFDLPNSNASEFFAFSGCTGGGGGPIQQGTLTITSVDGGFINLQLDNFIGAGLGNDPAIYDGAYQATKCFTLGTP